MTAASPDLHELREEDDAGRLEDFKKGGGGSERSLSQLSLLRLVMCWDLRLRLFTTLQPTHSPPPARCSLSYKLTHLLRSCMKRVKTLNVTLHSGNTEHRLLNEYKTLKESLFNKKIYHLLLFLHLSFLQSCHPSAAGFLLQRHPLFSPFPPPFFLSTTFLSEVKSLHHSLTGLQLLSAPPDVQNEKTHQRRSCMWAQISTSCCVTFHPASLYTQTHGMWPLRHVFLSHKRTTRTKRWR